MDDSHPVVHVIAVETLMAEREGTEGEIGRAEQLKVVRTAYKRHDLAIAAFFTCLANLSISVGNVAKMHPRQEIGAKCIDD